MRFYKSIKATLPMDRILGRKSLEPIRLMRGWASCRNLLGLIIVTVMATALASKVSAQEYYLDPEHTSVIFAVKHCDIGYTYGRFNKTEGEIALDPTIPKDSTFEFKIQVKSIDTNDDARDLYLRGPELLDSDQHPFIEFKSKEIIYEKPEGSRGLYNAKGTLTMHGKKKDVVLQIHVTGSGKDTLGVDRVGFLSKFTINRSEFGVTKFKERIGDQIAITFSAEAILKDPAVTDDDGLLDQPDEADKEPSGSVTPDKDDDNGQKI